MKLNELNKKTMMYYNPIYNPSDYIDGEGLSKKHLFQLMSAKDLNLSHISEIEKELNGNFPFIEEDRPYKWKYELIGSPLVEISGKIAHITFEVTRVTSPNSKLNDKKRYTIYIYLYKDEWHIL